LVKASHGRRHKKKQRAARVTTNVFSRFDPQQVEELKEAFQAIDVNNDEFIDRADLLDTMTAHSRSPPTDAEIDEMLR
jgi:Ca2+-binding EF-hand superfamily protein